MIEDLESGRSAKDVLEEQERLLNEFCSKPQASEPIQYKKPRDSGGVVEIVNAEIHQPLQQMSLGKAVPPQQKNVNPLYEFNRAKSGRFGFF